MAKLVFYSDQEIPENAKVDQRLLSLLGNKSAKIGYIPSSSDPSRKFYTHKKAYYEELGLNLALYFEIDQDYKSNDLDYLLSCDAIHLSGGNTYHFLYWLKSRGLILPLREYVYRGGVLIGTSAGAILMTPEISLSSIYGDAPLEGETMTDVTSLALVDFAFLPHLHSVNSVDIFMKEYSINHNSVIYGCQDGDGIIVDGDHVELIGDIQQVVNGIIVRGQNRIS